MYQYSFIHVFSTAFVSLCDVKFLNEVKGKGQHLYSQGFLDSNEDLVLKGIVYSIYVTLLVYLRFCQGMVKFINNLWIDTVKGSYSSYLMYDNRSVSSIDVSALHGKACNEWINK